MKGGVAAMVVAARAIARAGHGVPGSSWCSPRARRPVARALVDRQVPGSLGRVGALVVGEPTDLGRGSATAG